MKENDLAKQNKIECEYCVEQYRLHANASMADEKPEG